MANINLLPWRERARKQALNEFLVFGTVTCTALLSGALYNIFGWQAVNIGVVPPLVFVLCAVLWLSRHRAALAV